MLRKRRRQNPPMPRIPDAREAAITMADAIVFRCGDRSPSGRVCELPLGHELPHASDAALYHEWTERIELRAQAEALDEAARRAYERGIRHWPRTVTHRALLSLSRELKQAAEELRREAAR